MRIIKEIDPRIIKTHKVNLVKAYHFAKLIEDGHIFPPVKAELLPTGQYLVKNGAHRTYAHRMIGRLIKIKIAK